MTVLRNALVLARRVVPSARTRRDADGRMEGAGEVPRHGELKCSAPAAKKEPMPAEISVHERLKSMTAKEGQAAIPRISPRLNELQLIPPMKYDCPACNV